MGKSVDTKIVEMQLDNKEFESRVRDTLKSLTNLNKKVDAIGSDTKNLGNISKSLSSTNTSINEVASSVGVLEQKFSALGVAGMAVIANLTSSLMNMASRTANAFTIQPIKDGLIEYETQINSVQTIMGNTGRSVKDVNHALDQLNDYADRTIYNFKEMTRNAGMFTAAGMGLEDTMTTLKGVGNWAAFAGTNSQDMARATYQLSQALAAGAIRLQDWKSIETAGGMAGVKYQKAFIQTAKEHGIAIDQMIEKHGSFRESLTEAWLDNSVFLDTMRKFTVEGAKDYTKKMQAAGKMTKQEAEAMVKEATAMEDAATKVKTFSQLIDTAKEAVGTRWANIFRNIVGDFEEAKELWTGVSEFIEEKALSGLTHLSGMFTDWNILGGRKDLLTGLENIFKGLGSVLGPIQEAFRDVFPPITAKRLVEMTKGFKEFTSHLQLSKSQAEMLKNTFTGLFSIVKTGIDIFKGVAKAVFGFASALAPVGNVFLAIGSGIGNLFKTISDTVNKSGILDKLSSSITTAFGDLNKFLSKALNPDSLANGIDKIGKAFSGLPNAIGNGLTKLTTVLGPLNDFLKEFLKTIGLIGAGAAGVKFAQWLTNLGGLPDKLSGLFDGFKDIHPGKISEIFGAITDSIGAMQSKVKAEALKTIATSLLILAGAIAVLSMLDAEKAASGIIVLGMALGELMVAMAIMSKSAANVKALPGTIISLAAITTAALGLALSLKLLSTIDWDNMKVGLGGLTGVIILLSAASFAMGKISPAGIKAAGQMILFSVAIGAMALSLKALGNMQWDEIGRGLTAMGFAIGTLVLIQKAMSKLGVSGFAGGASLIVMSAGIAVLAKALKSMEDLDTTKLKNSAVAIAGIITVMTLFTKFGGSNILGATSLIIMAEAMTKIGEALTKFDFKDIGSAAMAIVSFGAVLTELAIALNAMNGAIGGAVAVSIAAMSLSLLIPQLIALSQLSLGDIVTALVGLAGALTVIGVGALLLTPAIVPLMGLSVALLAIGAAVALAGVGLTLLTAGFTALALAISTLANVSATGASQIAENITVMVESFANNHERLAVAFNQIFTTMLDSIAEMAPKIGETMLTVIDEILKSIDDHLPSIMESGGSIMRTLVAGISGEMFKPGETVGESINSALNTALNLSSGFMPIGLQIIGRLVSGVMSRGHEIASHVGQKIQEGVNRARGLYGAMFEAGSHVIHGLAAGIKNALAAARDAISGVCDSVIARAKAILRIASPSKVFKEIGQFVLEGLTVGLEDKKRQKEVINSVTGLISNLIDLTEDSKVKLGAGLLMEGAVQNSKDVVRFAVGSLEALSKRYTTIFGKEEDAIDAAAVSLEEYTVALYKNSKEFEQDTKQMEDHVSKLREMVKNREELKKQMAGAPTKNDTGGKTKTKDQLKQEIEQLDSSIEKHMETIANSAQKAAENIEKVYTALRENVRTTITKFLDPMAKKLASIDLFSATKSTSSSTSSTRKSPLDSTAEEINEAERLLNIARKKSESVQGRSQRYLDEVAAAEERLNKAQKKYSEQQEAEAEAKSKTISMVDRFRTNLEEYEDYRNQLDALALRDIDSVLFDKIKSLGIKGINEIKEFVSMTDAELSRANELYARSVHVSAQTMLSDYRQAFVQTEEWANKVRTLQEKGLDSHILQDLVKKGPEGIATLNAYLSMTAEELGEVNKLYSNTTTLTNKITDDIMASLVYAGSTTGQALTKGLAQGLAMENPELDTAVGDVNTAVIEPLEEGLSPTKGANIGKNVTDGIAQGLWRGENKVTRAARQVAIQAYNAARAALEIHSPSKKFSELGKFSVEGFSAGLSQFAYLAKNAGTDMVTATLSSAKSSLGKVTELISGVEDPTIKPILDLSNLRNGVQEVGALFGGRSLTANLALSAASGISSNAARQFTTNEPSQVDRSTNTEIVNHFHIKGDNPRVIAQEVSKIIQEETNRRIAVWE